jgi:DNA-binding CsgD family transcriptional regulator
LAPAAAQLGSSVNTLKTHLARILAKTGARNRAELAALISGMFNLVC